MRMKITLLIAGFGPLIAVGLFLQFLPNISPSNSTQPKARSRYACGASSVTDLFKKAKSRSVQPWSGRQKIGGIENRITRTNAQPFRLAGADLDSHFHEISLVEKSDRHPPSTTGMAFSRPAK